MLVVFAQHFAAMGREIDHDQPPARGERARRLAQGAGGIVEIMQDLMHHGEIDDLRVDRQGVNVALAQLHVAQARPFELRPRHAEHGRRKIDADGVFRARGEQFENPPGPAAYVEQAAPLRSFFLRRGENRGLDLGLRRVQLARFVPDRRMFGKIFLRLSGARGAHVLQPRAVTGEDRILAVEPRQYGARQSRARPLFRGAEKSPCAFAMPIDQTGFEQQT